MKKVTLRAALVSVAAVSLAALMGGLQPISPTFPDPGVDHARAMSMIQPLVGGRWKAEGTWASGEPFHHEQEFEWGAGERIVKARTYAPGGEGLPPRLQSEGVRAFDEEAGKTLFWEFAASGGITAGWIGVVDEITFFYEYLYEVGGRERTIRDQWTRIDDDHYLYKAGAFEEGVWQETYVEGRFTRTAGPETCPQCGRPLTGAN